jgi:predicted phage terminase large subunit-like protein
MLFLPPGSAKSTYASKLFPPWFMAYNGWGTNIIGASNTAELASSFSREVQGIVQDNKLLLGYHPTNENAELWKTSNGCQYRAAGVGGTIAGFRADLAIIDDPVKSAKDVMSPITREDHYRWFYADIVSRIKPGGRIVLVQTRWHEDDLGGRLLELFDDSWRVINLPATAVENDPLGREPGEMLWGDDAYGYGAELATRKLEHEKAGAMRDWNALYEQTPRSVDGGIFNTTAVKYLDFPPLDLKRTFRAWDLAATEQTGKRNPDWTVGVKLAETQTGRFVVLDIVRMRGTPDAVAATIVQTAQMDGKSVRISLPQDPGQAGKAQVAFLTSKLRGFTVQNSPETGDKSTRAMPFASQMNVGNVDLVRGAWNAAYVEELQFFPTGAKDDQVDASSRGFNAVIAAPAPARWVNLNIMGR